jgi:hypothetical protein
MGTDKDGRIWHHYTKSPEQHNDIRAGIWIADRKHWLYAAHTAGLNCGIEITAI